MPTWLLTIIALAALIAAILAYRKQANASASLAEQVRLQRQALADQQAANAKQAEALEAELGELCQRAEAVARQQASQVVITPGKWQGRVPGVRADDGKPVHMALITNGWHRPIRNVVCRLQTSQHDLLYSACLVGRMADAGVSPMTGEVQRMLVDEAEDTKIRLIKAQETGAFVFIYDVANHQGILTVRFTDDAGLHWKIDNDPHLERLPNRDDW